MKKQRLSTKLLLLLLLAHPLLISASEKQTIEEKLSFVKKKTEENQALLETEVNQTLINLRDALKDKYALVEELSGKQAAEEEFEDLLDEINFIKEEISSQEARFYKAHHDEIGKESEDAEVWNQEDVTLSQLVMEYGALDYLYLIPPELSSTKIHLYGSVPILRSNWSELLDLILRHNGIGVRKINQYVKQLYLLKQDFISVSAIASKRFELDALADNARVVYIYSPPVENLKTCYYFLERFRDAKTSHVYQVGAKIAIVASKEEVKRLITLAENVWEEGEEKNTKVVTLSKVSPDEMTKVLKAFFVGLADPNRSILSLKGGHDLSVIPLQSEHGVVLIGSKKLIERAEHLIQQTEAQVDDPNEVTVYWYTCRHSSPNELSDILEKVYHSFLYSSLEGSTGSERSRETTADGSYLPFPPADPMQAGMEDDPYAPIDSLRYVPPSHLGAGGGGSGQDRGSGEAKRPANFIAHPATGSILMVVRKDVLPKIKETLRHLDTPKRMVEIEVLLCERRFHDATRSGINLLKLGSGASDTGHEGASYNTSSDAPVKGLFEFFISSPKRGYMPKFDVVYNFLLSQEDIKVTASPSVTTINQTPATIAITDQISINNGASPVNSSSGNIIFKDSYERADFGITITLTPTVHEPDPDDLNSDFFVTMENDISFETIKNDAQSRPDVHQRKVKNHVRIADGQTVILGGLRSRSQENKNEKIPFLGEIPGIGKLFGSTVSTEKNNEMFIFIKPRVIKDPQSDLIRIREARLRRRPGDTDLILDKIRESRSRTSKRAFQRSFELLIGGQQDNALSL